MIAGTAGRAQVSSLASSSEPVTAGVESVQPSMVAVL
jgi:hypothetical protein